MNKVACLVLLLALSIVNGLKFKAGVNVSLSENTDGSWRYRNTALKAVGGIEFDVVYYTSRSVNRDKDQRTWNVSGIVGAGVFLATQVPFSFVAAYESDKQIGLGSGAGFKQLDTSDSLAYMATAYARLEERAPNGTVVNVQSLRYNRDVQYSVDQEYKDGVLSAASVVGRPSSGSWNINITFISSSVVGVIDLANAVVSPSSFEQVVQINNWQYQSNQNHLTLVMITASGSSSSSSSRYLTSVVSGSGSAQVYFTSSSSAVVNGNTVAVNVKTEATATVDPDLQNDNFFLSQVVSRYTSASFTKVTVDFPAGASSIQYDPSVGSGQPVSGETTQSSSSSSSLVACSFLLLLSLAILL